jgi:hypothetical protein
MKRNRRRRRNHGALTEVSSWMGKKEGGGEGGGCGKGGGGKGGEGMSGAAAATAPGGAFAGGALMVNPLAAQRLAQPRGAAPTQARAPAAAAQAAPSTPRVFKNYVNEEDGAEGDVLPGALAGGAGGAAAAGGGGPSLISPLRVVRAASFSSAGSGRGSPPLSSMPGSPVDFGGEGGSAAARGATNPLAIESRLSFAMQRSSRAMVSRRILRPVMPAEPVP